MFDISKEVNVFELTKRGGSARHCGLNLLHRRLANPSPASLAGTVTIIGRLVRYRLRPVQCASCRAYGMRDLVRQKAIRPLVIVVRAFALP